MKRPPRGKVFWSQGEPLVWATGAALALTLSLAFALLAVVLVNGLGVFWPRTLYLVTLKNGEKLLGAEVERSSHHELAPLPENATAAARAAWLKHPQYRNLESIKFYVGNMEDGPAFRWVAVDDIAERTAPANAFLLDRTSDMSFIGFLVDIKTPTLTQPAAAAADADKAAQLRNAIAEARAFYEDQTAPVVQLLRAKAGQQTHEIKYRLLRAEYDLRRLVAAGGGESGAHLQQVTADVEHLRAENLKLLGEIDRLKGEVNRLERQVEKNVAVFADAGGREKPIPLLKILRFYQPNRMGLGEKIAYYFARVWELLTADPRESNQEGGLFPAIFGTVLMVFLMAIFCFPLGVLAGIYLGEYAREGALVRLVRVAVNNLAGIPSIVYGIFGLGFFIYTIGGHLDQWFFPERISAGEPVFGQGCILWASLTLGLLTIPVVIVSTEEALRAIPRGINEGSYALGATKFQTLCRVLVPMASPGMMTGFILAMARAAGEVAPLMLTGAVKIAPVPFDSNPPFIHLDRQFMHLGFHILDISCKSPNVEATKPMVYVTTLLLLAIVLSMTSLAIFLRNRMRRQYQSRAI